MKDQVLGRGLGLKEVQEEELVEEEATEIVTAHAFFAKKFAVFVAIRFHPLTTKIRNPYRSF